MQLFFILLNFKTFNYNGMKFIFSFSVFLVKPLSPMTLKTFI